MPERPGPEVEAEMARAVRRGCNYLEFAGGENTIRPDFIRLVERARKMGYARVAVATNGRMLAYGDFSRRLFDSGLTDIILSIHGPDAELHDGLTGVAGSFSQLLRGIENVRKYFRGTVGTNTAVTKRNYRRLPEIGRFIARFGFRNSDFIYADPSYGGVRDNFRELMPRISECAPYMRACLDLASGWVARRGPRALEHNWSARYVPFCYFADYYPYQISEAREAAIYANVSHFAPDYSSPDAIRGRREAGRVKTEKCLGCALYDECEGIWNEYLKVYGDGELKPLKRPVPRPKRRTLR